MFSKRVLPAAVGAVLCLLAAFVYAAGTRADADDSPIGLEGVLKPLPEGGYLFSGTITELNTGETLAAPQLRFASGDRASVTIRQEGQTPLVLTAEADGAQRTAVIDLRRMREGGPIRVSRLEVHLR